MRICTWNIQLGLKIDAVVDTVRSHKDFKGLDLLCLQEASIHDGIEDAARVAEAMDGGYEHFQATAQLRRGLEQGNALIWRPETFQPALPQVLPLSAVAARFARVERALLRAVPPQQRMAIRAESHSLRVYVMHLDVVGFTHKLEQLRTVIADMTARPPVPMTVVAGDLNTFGPPRLQLWKRLDAAAREAGLVDVTRHVGRTHRTGQKLDAIFVRTGFELEHRAWALDVRASDHQPVFADLDMRGAG